MVGHAGVDATGALLALALARHSGSDMRGLAVQLLLLPAQLARLTTAPLRTAEEEATDMGPSSSDALSLRGALTRAGAAPGMPGLAPAVLLCHQCWPSPPVGSAWASQCTS